MTYSEGLEPGDGPANDFLAKNDPVHHKLDTFEIYNTQQEILSLDAELASLEPSPRIHSFDPDTLVSYVLGKTIADIPARSLKDPETLNTHWAMAHDIQKTMEYLLTPNQQTVLTLMHGLNGVTTMTQAEIAIRLDLKHSRISQIAAKGILILRNGYPLLQGETINSTLREHTDAK